MVYQSARNNNWGRAKYLEEHDAIYWDFFVDPVLPKIIHVAMSDDTDDGKVFRDFLLFLAKCVAVVTGPDVELFHRSNVEKVMPYDRIVIINYANAISGEYITELALKEIYGDRSKISF